MSQPIPLSIDSKVIQSLLSLRALYPLVLGTVIGANVWNSFAAGPISYMTLPRQQFGNLQSKLFPPFFALQAVGSGLLLAGWYSAKTLSKTFSLRDSNTFNATLLAVSFVTALSNLGYAGPWATEIMRTRHRVEKLENTTYSTLPQSERMKSLNSRFAIAHSVSTILNLVGLTAVSVHAMFLGVYSA